MSAIAVEQWYQVQTNVDGSIRMGEVSVRFGPKLVIVDAGTMYERRFARDVWQAHHDNGVSTYGRTAADARFRFCNQVRRELTRLDGRRITLERHLDDAARMEI